MSARRVERFSGVPTPRRLVAWLIVLNVEAALVVGYFAVTDAAVTTPRHLVYPFVWLNVGGWAVLRVDLPKAPARRRILAGAAAAGYFAALLWIAGLVGLGPGGLGLDVTMAAPGWGPILHLDVGAVAATLVPFMVAGYAALAVLGYAALLDAVTGAVPAVVGLASCVGCAWPIAASVLSVATGGATGALGAIAPWSYGLSTVVYVAAVGLLLWRPGTEP